MKQMVEIYIRLAEMEIKSEVTCFLYISYPFFLMTMNTFEVISIIALPSNLKIFSFTAF